MFADAFCDMDSSLYCIEAENYPAAQIEALAQNIIESGAFIIGSDTLNHSDKQRSNLETEERICETEKVAILPRMVRNRKDIPVFIIQSDKFRQMIIVEKCA